MLIPSRLKLSRYLLGITAKELSQRVDVTAGRISQLENGRGKPASKALLARLSLALEVSPEFLTDGEDVDLHEKDRTHFHFRRRARLSARLRLRVEAQTHLFNSLREQLDTYFELQPSAVPCLERPADLDLEGGVEFAEQAAQEVRARWGMGDGPIPHLVALLESRGVWVQVLGAETQDVDAFCYWDGDHAHIFLNWSKQDMARSRLDAAHELGHLVMHDGLETGVKAREDEAFRFAGAFLMPARAWLREAPESTNWRDYVALTSRWRVSIQAMFRRSLELGILSHRQYRTAQVRISSEIGRAKEKAHRAPIPMEQPNMLSMFFNELRAQGCSPWDVCDEARIPQRWSAQLLKQAGVVADRQPRAGKVFTFKPEIDSRR